MARKISRRDFLKLSSLYLSYPFLASRASRFRFEDPEKPNILIVVYDTFTATHMSLYGYQRDTTPNINRLADKAIVYHRHYAGGHWTFPGTSSLLTGALPWSYRGFDQGTQILPPYDTENLFSYFDDYFSMAYTHNAIADEVLNKLIFGLDYLHERTKLYLYKAIFLNTVLRKDFDLASISKLRITNRSEEGYASSLFLSNLSQWIRQFRERELRENFVVPPSITASGELFLLEDATDWMIKQTKEIQRPFLEYIHLIPPHDPYIVRNDFADAFQDDGFVPVRKPTHFFTQIDFRTHSKTDEFRLAYNRAIRYVDAEFGRLMEGLEREGQLDNTIVILTSDHGELFERNMVEHTRPVFYQSIINVPLMIFMPGQTERVDVYDNTSALDVIPTLLHLTGRDRPAILEGTVLPPFAALDPNRSIFAVDARDNPPLEKLSLYTAMLRKGPYKFIQYYGYPQLPNGEPYFELYNLEEDPEELDNLFEKEVRIASEMRAELDEKIHEKDQPYGRD